MSLVKLNLSSMSVLEKIQFAFRVNDALLDHALTFPNPPVAAEDFVTMIGALQTEVDTLEAARGEVRLRTSTVKDATGVVDQALRQLATYVQTVSHGNAATIELAGMDVRGSSSARVGALPVPESFNVLAGRNPGTAVLRWKVVKHAATYVVQRRESAALPFDFNASETSTRTRFDATGLASATRYWFRVAANGAAGLSDWTSAVSVVTQ